MGRGTVRWEGKVLQHGDPVYGAEDWPRIEAWVRCGRLEPV